MGLEGAPVAAILTHRVPFAGRPSSVALGDTGCAMSGESTSADKVELGDDGGSASASSALLRAQVVLRACLVSLRTRVFMLLRPRHRYARRGSEFVTSYLKGLRGAEIGAAAHNRFFLDAINVDRWGGSDTPYKRYERSLVLRAARVDVVAEGADLPLEDDSLDFVFSSHVIEHFPDPIRALYEWVRVARRYVVVIAPHRDRTFDADRPLTTVEEFLTRHSANFNSDQDLHWSVWTCESFLRMCEAAGLRVVDYQDPDDKIGNGFTVVIDASIKPAGLRIGSAAGSPA